MKAVLSIFILLALLAGISSGCISTPAAAVELSGPETVAAGFFNAYIEQSNAGISLYNQQGFKGREALSEDFLHQAQEIQAGFDGAGFDPVMKAQMMPPLPVRVVGREIEGDEAKVILGFGEPKDNIDWKRTVFLKRFNRQWQIVPDPVEGGPLTPIQTVEAFYHWYLNYMQGGPEPRSALADKAYRSAPYLSHGLVNQVDQMGAGPNGFGFDPFLCAQDVPSLQVGTFFYNNARPVVVIKTSFGTFLTADLLRADFNRWEIIRITCGNNAMGLVKAAYAWVLGYMTESGEMRNPWVEGAYINSGFFTQAFIERLNEQLASGTPLPADPMILAQNLPDAFQVEAGPYPECALVNMQFGDATVRQLKVTVEIQNGQLRIASANHTPAPEIPQPALSIPGIEHWSPFSDEQYGFSFQYPSEWAVSGVNVNDRHTPQEYPVMRDIRFRQADGDKQRAGFFIRAILGDENVVEGIAPRGEKEETFVANRSAGKAWQDDLGTTYIVFKHPSRPGLWVVFQESGQNDGNPAIFRSAVMNAVLSTLTFIP